MVAPRYQRILIPLRHSPELCQERRKLLGACELLVALFVGTWATTTNEG